MGLEQPRTQGTWGCRGCTEVLSGESPGGLLSALPQLQRCPEPSGYGSVQGWAPFSQEWSWRYLLNIKVIGCPSKTQFLGVDKDLQETSHPTFSGVHLGKAATLHLQ